MERMRRTFLIFCLQILAVSIWATDSLANEPKKIPSVTIITKGKIVEVLYSSRVLCNTKVEIKNSAGHVVFSETVRTRNGFSRPYNLSGLPPGVYKVIISNEHESSSQQITIKRKGRHKANTVVVAGIEIP